MIHEMPVIDPDVLAGPIPSRQHLVRESPLALKHGGVRGDGKTRFLVLHMTAGASAVSSIEHMAKVGTSYNYLVERDGVIYRCVEHHLTAYHAGDSRWPGSDGNTMNDESVGICMANYCGAHGKHEPVTLEQYTSVLWLSMLMSNIYRIRSYLALGHLEVSPGRRRDPDVQVFSMYQFRSDLATQLFRQRRAGIVQW